MVLQLYTKQLGKGIGMNDSKVSSMCGGRERGGGGGRGRKAALKLRPGESSMFRQRLDFSLV